MDFIYAIELSEETGTFENNVSEVDILTTGTFKTRSKGEFEITASDLDAVVSEFQTSNAAGKRQIDIDHAAKLKGDSKAAGWIIGLRRVGNKVRAAVEWTPVGQQLIKDKIYKFMSSEYLTKLEDKSTGEYSDIRRIAAATLTNRPFLENMDPVTLSEGQIAEVYTPTKEELLDMLLDATTTDEARVAMREALEGVLEGAPGATADNDETKANDVDAAKLRAELSLSEDADETAIMAAIGSLKEGAKAPPMDGYVTLAEFDQVKEAALSAGTELRAIKREQLLDDATREGRITSGERELMAKLYDKDADMAREMLAARTPNPALYTELGSGAAATLTEATAARTERDPERRGLAAAVNKMLAEHPTMSYGQALSAVAKGAGS